RIDLTVDRASGRTIGHHIFPPHDICERDDLAGTCAPPDVGAQARYESAQVTPSAAIDAILAPAIAAGADLKKKPLNASIDETLPRQSSGESALGNLLADWMRLAAGSVDVAIANTGGIRAALPAGPITYGRLFEVTPFDNREARLTLTGAELATV